jgi:glutamyl-tRNA synthetase
LLIYDALGWDRPQFAHLPLILAPTGKGKLSKRKHPEAALELYQQQGYPVEAVINWLALVGWSFDDKTEIMTRQELIERFSFDRVNSSGAHLPMDKLNWLSGEYIRAMAPEALGEAITPFLLSHGCIVDGDDARLPIIVECVQPRISCYQEAVGHVDWAFTDIDTYDKKAAKNLRKDGAIDLLQSYAPTLLQGDFSDPAALEADARNWCESNDKGFGKLVHPVRAALTGRSQGPGLFHCAALLGSEVARARVARAAQFVETSTP